MKRSIFTLVLLVVAAFAFAPCVYGKEEVLINDSTYVFSELQIGYLELSWNRFGKMLLVWAKPSLGTVVWNGAAPMDFDDKTIFTGPVQRKDLEGLKGRRVRVFARNILSPEKPANAFTLHITLLQPEIEFWYPDYPAELQKRVRENFLSTRNWVRRDIRNMIKGGVLKKGEAIFAMLRSEDMLNVDESAVVPISSPREIGERKQFFLIYFRDYGKVLVWHYWKVG